MLNLECYLCCTIHLYILHYQSYPQNRLEHYTTIATQNLSQFPMNESIQSGHIPPVHTLHLASSTSVYAMYSWMQWLALVKPSNMCWHSVSRTIQKTRKVEDTINLHITDQWVSGDDLHHTNWGVMQLQDATEVQQSCQKLVLYKG
jgi:hypothetical protein